MSPEDVTAALRPISLIGDYEYTLNDADAREFALAIQEVARAEKGTEGGIGARPLGEPAIEGPPQREPGTEQPLELAEPKAIFGADDRYSINGSRSSFPWNNYAAMDQAGTCSAVKLVNHHTAVTAAHCVHTGSSWKTRKRITFGGLATVGSTCYGMTVPGCWDGSTSDPSCDYATIKFREGWGYCDFSTYNVGYLGWQSVGDWVTGIWGHVSGYPSDQMKPGWVYPELVFHQRGDGYSTPTYPARVFYLVDTSGGQSGGPFTSYYASGDYRIRGVHKGVHYGAFEDTNQARKMTQSLFNWFVANGGW
jgi:V8-like Glu-specific endopeptidase